MGLFVKIAIPVLAIGIASSTLNSCDHTTPITVVPTSAKPTALTAAQLSANFDARRAAHDYKAALQIANSLRRRFPDSPEAVSAAAQIPSVQLGEDKQRSDAQKAPFLNQVASVTEGLRDLNLRALTSLEGASLVVDVFSLGADLILTSKNLQLSASEQASVKAMRAILVKRQIEAFPILREKSASLMNKSMWEADMTARTFGAGHTTVEFVAGAFAAHSNIQSTEQIIEPALVRLRFKRADYMWIPHADDGSEYKIDSPADDAVAKVDRQGSVVLVD
jgi:hypothetical protein